jgi:hypothetical protein
MESLLGNLTMAEYLEIRREEKTGYEYRVITKEGKDRIKGVKIHDQLIIRLLEE